MNFVDLLEKYKIIFNETYKIIIISITIPGYQVQGAKLFLSKET